MSGPKVVRVVTREELVATSSALLARLDAAVGHWTQESGGLIKEPEIKETNARRDALAGMLAADRFAEFGQAVVKEIDFLQADAERRRERAVQARALERIRRTNGQELAKTLLATGRAFPPDTRARLEEALLERLSVAELDAVLARARVALFTPEAEGITSEQRALAQRLAVGEADLSFEAWRAKGVKLDARLQSTFAYLSELEALGCSAEATGFEREIQRVQELTDSVARDMRLDTLVLNARKSRDGALSKVRLLRQIGLIAAELASATPDSEALGALRAAALTNNIEQLQALAVLGKEEQSKVQAAAAVLARRKAVLEGLQRLGYQVQEGLSTVTADSGRLVVRSPGDSRYGVEILTGSNQKMQVRSVAFNAVRDTSQDVPEERRWCGDLSKLQATLQAEGGELIVEKSLGVGVVPLRVVADLEERRHRAAPSQARRGG